MAFEFLNENAEKFSNEIYLLRKKQDEILNKIHRIMENNCEGRDVDRGHRVGLHECEKSPIGICVYDGVEDPSWDSCLYCPEPHERK